MSHYKGGELLGKGSYGCVFSPSIPCNSSRKPDPKQVSKVFFHSKTKEKVDQEYSMNQLIRKIPSHKTWAVTLNTRCSPPSYKEFMSYDPSIQICLENAKKTSQEYDEVRSMLIGPKSETTLYSYFMKHYTYKIFSQPRTFTSMFVETMKSMESLFMGLTQMNQSKICHLDIKDDNVVVDKGSMKFIDFGMAQPYKNHLGFQTRSQYVFTSTSLYLPYPPEFIFLFASTSQLNDELQRLNQGIYRNHLSDYQGIHEDFFTRSDSVQYHLSLVQTMMSEKPSFSEVIDKLDTYSVGMLVPFLLYKLGIEYDMYETVLRLIQLPKVKPFMKLFKLMTHPDCKSRISAKQVKALFTKLKSRYLQKKTKKRSKRRSQRNKRSRSKRRSRHKTRKRSKW